LLDLEPGIGKDFDNPVFVFFQIIDLFLANATHFPAPFVDLGEDAAWLYHARPPQERQPQSVRGIGFVTLGLLEVPRVNQRRFYPMARKNAIGRGPENAGAFHERHFDAVVFQP
jgi:hypothetical protein